MLFCFVQALFYPSFVFLTLINLKLYKNYLILFFVIGLPGIVITVSGVSRLKALVLVSFNSALNPVLYCWRISEMRQAVYSNLFYIIRVYMYNYIIYALTTERQRLQGNKAMTSFMCASCPKGIAMLFHSYPSSSNR